MSSFYEDKECPELGLSQVNSEELEFDYLFNYEPPDSDFPSGDLKGLFFFFFFLVYLVRCLLRGVSKCVWVCGIGYSCLIPVEWHCKLCQSV